LRDVFGTTSGQPFVVSGSGTLAMEMAVANTIEPGDGVLVIDTGYFSDRMARLLERYGANVTRIGASVGTVPPLSEVERIVQSGGFKALTVTHVDTSTGVRAPVAPIAGLAKRYGVLSIVDGVCATGGEALEQDGWGVDVALTASQKALGAPPGLAIVVASPRAMQAWRERRSRVASMYADFGEWLPIMEAYEQQRPAYFATPPVNLVAALDVSLGQILAEGMAPRVARHARLAAAFRAGIRALDLRFLPTTEDVCANTLSAIYYPEGVDASLVARIREEGVVVAGGLHPELRTRYFRVGHMGVVSSSDVLATLGAIERALARAGYAKARGALAAAEEVLVAPLP
jgi:alanine-glyoxylate transaminase/serine-glyoxylate transaminase/serine-pyruvate transaminase